MENLENKIAIITPSYINSRTRFLFAKKSMESLESILNNRYHHIVVDDKPKSTIVFPNKLHPWLPGLKWHKKSNEIYDKPNVSIIERFVSGSASAVLRSVREAINKGKSFGFIHLDDHVYIPTLKSLIDHASKEFDYDSSLMMVRFSGYPLIHNDFVPLTYENDQILIDSVVLRPQRRKDYTLWWSFFNENSVDGGYWPIALWFCLYRLDFLEELLSYAPVQRIRNLGHVELFYKDKDNWRQFLKRVEGKFGYINMQFGGFEMHRNKNWQELLQLPNEAVI
jgi:hypothetical protein